METNAPPEHPDPHLDAQHRSIIDQAEQLRAMNQALLLGSLRQHELVDVSEELNAQLRSEISERQQAEIALRASEERFRTLFELVPVAIYSCDRSGVILEFNHYAAELWGRKPALGVTDEQFCGSYKLFRTDGTFISHDQCPMAEVLQGKIPSATELEVLIERPDGTRVTVLVSIRPLKNDSGEITGAINCFYDITERKKGERELLEKARLLDLSNDAIVVHDLDDKVRWWGKGAEQLYGWTSEEAIGKRIDTLLHMEFPRPVREIVAQLERDGHFSGELIQVTRDGRRVAALCRWVLDRPTKSVLTSYTDITERRKLEDSLVAKAEELALADRGKDEFLAMLAHELRNPLMPLKGAAEMLRMINSNDPAIVKIQGILERQTNHMTRLVDDLLDSSRIQHRKVTLHKVSLDVASSVLSVLDAVRDSIKSNNQILTVDVRNDPPLYINADPARFAQIVSNLVINAVKYTPKNGAIHFSIAREGPMAVVRVRDNGIGIEAHMLKAIFGLFTQVEVSLERAQGGLGLGLKLVKELVEMQDGTVEARSAGKGHGSEFIVRFPESKAVVLMLPADEAPTAVTGHSILLIDDNDDILESMSMILKLSGHRVQTANDGIVGVEKALQQSFDVALVDIGLPGMNGYEVAQKIRSQSGGQDVVLIALTGYGQEKDKSRAQEAGFDQHLTKPVDPKVLQRLLNELGKLKFKRLRKEKTNDAETIPWQ